MYPTLAPRNPAWVDKKRLQEIEWAVGRTKAAETRTDAAFTRQDLPGAVFRKIQVFWADSRNRVTPDSSVCICVHPWFHCLLPASSEAEPRHSKKMEPRMHTDAHG